MHHFSFLGAVSLKRILNCCIQDLKKTSAKNKFLLYGSPPSYLKYFLFYFDKDSEANSSEEKSAQSLIGYLYGCAFMLYNQSCAKNGEMDEDTGSYMVVNTALRGEFELKWDLYKCIEDALPLKLFGKHPVYEFSLKAEKGFEEAGFTMKQKFVSLSKPVVINEKMQNIIILGAPSSFHKLRSVLQSYEESCSRFHQSRRVTIVSTVQDGS